MNDLITSMGIQNFLSLFDFLGYIDLGHFLQLNDAQTSIVNGLKKISGFLKVVGLAVAAVYVAIAGYQFMWGGPNGSQAGKTYLLNAVIGLVLIYGAGEIANWVADNVANF